MKKKISQVFSEHRVNSVLFTNEKNIFYLTNAQFNGFWILFVKNKTYVICYKMIENQAKEYFNKQNIYVYIGTSLCKIVVEILEQNKITNLLIDLKYMCATDFILISKNLNRRKINVTEGMGILDNMRLIKNLDEIKNIKKACLITSQICNIIKRELKPGLTEVDIHYRVLELFAKNQVTESFTPIIASGKNSSHPHHVSSIRKITENDIIMIDIGCIYNGYCSDLTRTYFLGKIDDRYIKAWNAVRNAQTVIFKNIKSGLPISWANRTAKDIVEISGYKDKFIHNVGHGIGIEIHEKPFLTSDVKCIFLTHMTITIEPGIYIKNEFGVRIEDTILIRKNNCEILTLAKY
jgi:Xaa-Pro aminopeptidase